MSIPDFQTMMLPLLELAGDTEQIRVRDAIEELADRFELTEAEREELLPSGRQARLNNRVGWASTYLRKAGLLSSKKRGVISISPTGRKVLENPPEGITISYLQKFDSFQEFRSGSESTSSGKSPIKESCQESAATPEEIVEAAYLELRQTLATEVIQQVMESSPMFFERLVVDLLVRMGYGGTRKDAGQAIGQSGDNGVDGIIKEDRLGLDTVYVQAKRWARDNKVSRPEVQKFAGALQGFHAHKGVFITTSDFTDGATRFAATIGSKIVLINGERLADLMIDFGVGVATTASYEVKRVDTDYFDE